MNSSNRVLVLVLYSIVLFTTVSAEPGPYQLLQEVFMHVQNSGEIIICTSKMILMIGTAKFVDYLYCTGTCAGAGHRNGCCQGSPTACSVPLQDGFCYCDENCHRTEECCRDIFSINCVGMPISITRYAYQIMYILYCAATTCANAGLSPGCCNWFQDNCRTSGRCYCDRFCRFFNDCCPDVPQNLRCSRKGKQ